MLRYLLDFVLASCILEHPPTNFCVFFFWFLSLHASFIHYTSVHNCICSICATIHKCIRTQTEDVCSHVCIHTHMYACPLEDLFLCYFFFSFLSRHTSFIHYTSVHMSISSISAIIHKFLCSHVEDLYSHICIHAHVYVGMHTYMHGRALATTHKHIRNKKGDRELWTWTIR